MTTLAALLGLSALWLILQFGVVIGVGILAVTLAALIAAVVLLITYGHGIFYQGEGQG